MASDVGDSLRRFLSWWARELRASVPDPISALFTGGDRILEVSLRPGEMQFFTIRGGRRRTLGSVALAEKKPGTLKRKVRDVLRRARTETGNVVVRLPGTKVLRPRADLPISAAHNMREALAAEMDRYTPFASEDVLFDFRVAGSDAELERIAVDLEVARKSDVEQSVEFIRELGLSPSRVTGSDDTSSAYAEMNLLPDEIRPRRRRILEKLVAAAAVATVIMAGVAFATWVQRQERMLERAEQRVADLRIAAGGVAREQEVVDRLVALLGAVADERSRTPLVVEILRELTERLPDEHWLSTLTIREDALTISGFSNESSKLLRLLDDSNLLGDVRFGSPVTRDPRLDTDRFTITATIARNAGAK